MPTQNINGINIHYEIRGEGFPLVLIMGLGANSDWWTPQMVERLAGKYRVLLFDNRGAGRSDAPESDYSISLFAQDTVELMKSQGIEKAHLFGMSMGGMISQEIALSYPDRVDKLVLGCTNCGVGHSVQPPEEVVSILANPGGDQPQDLLKILFPEEFLARNMDKTVRFISRYSIAPIGPGAFMRQLRAIMNFDSYGRLEQIKSPTLVITGDSDVLIPPVNSEILARKIPGARLVTLEGCGHGFMAQEPESVANTLLEFLG